MTSFHVKFWNLLTSSGVARFYSIFLEKECLIFYIAGLNAETNLLTCLILGTMSNSAVDYFISSSGENNQMLLNHSLARSMTDFFKKNSRLTNEKT